MSLSLALVVPVSHPEEHRHWVHHVEQSVAPIPISIAAEHLEHEHQGVGEDVEGVKGVVVVVVAPVAAPKVIAVVMAPETLAVPILAIAVPPLTHVIDGQVHGCQWVDGWGWRWCWCGSQ